MLHWFMMETEETDENSMPFSSYQETPEFVRDAFAAMVHCPSDVTDFIRSDY